jgi:hypothetical protein
VINQTVIVLWLFQQSLQAVPVAIIVPAVSNMRAPVKLPYQGQELHSMSSTFGWLSAFEATQRRGAARRGTAGQLRCLNES